MDAVSYSDTTVPLLLWNWQIQPTPVAKLRKKMGQPVSVVRETSA